MVLRVLWSHDNEVVFATYAGGPCFFPDSQVCALRRVSSVVECLPRRLVLCIL